MGEEQIQQGGRVALVALVPTGGEHAPVARCGGGIDGIGLNPFMAGEFAHEQPAMVFQTQRHRAALEAGLELGELGTQLWELRADAEVLGAPVRRAV